MWMASATCSFSSAARCRKKSRSSGVEAARARASYSLMVSSSRARTWRTSATSVERSLSGGPAMGALTIAPAAGTVKGNHGGRSSRFKQVNAPRRVPALL